MQSITEKNSNKQIAIGAIISYATIGINLLIGLLYTPWMINSIGKSDYGLYTLAISIINVVTIDFGLSAATSRFVSKKLSEGDKEGVNNVVGMIMRLYTVIAAIACIALIAVYPFLGGIYAGLSDTEMDKFRVVYIIVASYSLLSFPFVSLNGIFSAYEKFIAMKLCDLFSKFTSMALVIIFLLSGKGLFALVTTNAVVGLVTILIRLLIVKHIGVRFNIRYRDRDMLHEIFAFSIWTTVVGICTRLIFNLVPSILGMVSNSSEITFYGVASTIDGYFYTFASAISSLFLAKVMRLTYGANKDKNKIDDLAVSVGRLQLVIISLLYIGFFSIGREFVRLWMGEEYSITYYCILLLSFPDIIEYSQHIYATAVTASGIVKQQAIAYGVTTAITLPITFIGSYFLGSVGASIAICLACVCRTVTMCVVYKKELDVNLKLFFTRTYPRIIPVFIVCIVYSIFVNRVWKIDSWLMLIIKGFLITIVYFSAVLAFFIQDKKEFIKRIALTIKRQ